MGGGFRVLDLKGNLVLEKEVGYCEALTLVSRTGKSPVVVGFFFKPNDPGKTMIWNKKGKQFLAGFDVTTGKKLWEKELSDSEKPYWFPQHRLLFTATCGDDSNCILFSPKSTQIYTPDGKQLTKIPKIGIEMLVDFNGDGSDEIVFCKKKQSYDKGGQLSIVDLKGRVLWESPEGVWRVCCAEDLDNDGWRELLAIRLRPSTKVAVFRISLVDQ
jgi:hypothetical protein